MTDSPSSAVERQPKNIVLLSDGTGNSGGKGHGTNVWRIYQGLAQRGGQGARQIAFYDDGVGTEDNKLLRALGGACGWGLTRNVLELYTRLAQSYRPGDRIYLFGYSRGAYTVRTLAGMICQCGIVDLSDLDDPLAIKHRVKQAHRLYKQRDSAALKQYRAEHAISHHEHAPNGDVSIRFIGAWDTVDAVGLPFDWPTREILDSVFHYRFPDCKLHERVEQACHALAIDDARRTFHPVMWEKDERIEQVWFAGMHGNVGGGYPRDHLALNSLNWMLGKAEQAGLRFDPARRFEFLRDANSEGQLYDSRAGLGCYYRYDARRPAQLCCDAGLGETITLHASVVERMAHSSNGYHPGNLRGDVRVVGSVKRSSLGVLEPLEGQDAESLASMEQHLASRRDEIDASQNAIEPVLNARKLAYFCQLLASGAVLVVGGPQLAGALLSGDTLGALDVLAKLEIGVTLTLAAAGLIIFAWQRSLKQSERSIGMRLWQKLRPFPAADSNKAAE